MSCNNYCTSFEPAVNYSKKKKTKITMDTQCKSTTNSCVLVVFDVIPEADY